MSKLSDPLKALINAPFARPGPTPAPRNIRAVYERVAKEASEHHVGRPAWITLSTATTMTMNSPESMTALFYVATDSKSQEEKVKTAELMREVGLKCIGFNGIPRTINMLGDFRSSLPIDVRSSLNSIPSRVMLPETLNEWKGRGRALWDSVYKPFESKLLDKLADSHPDLPVHIINSNYAPLFTDPADRPGGVRAGRILTSLLAIACLRAQTGVAPQVISHVFGLRKAVDDGTWKAPEVTEEEVKWLASEEGNVWILNTVDKIVEAIGQQQGTTFAPGLKAKL